jgi:hypothetical protein
VPIATTPPARAEGAGSEATREESPERIDAADYGCRHKSPEWVKRDVSHSQDEEPQVTAPLPPDVGCRQPTVDSEDHGSDAHRSRRGHAAV